MAENQGLSKNIKLALGIGGGALFALVVYFLLRNRITSCPTEIKVIEASDNYMRPYFEKGSKVNVEFGYYACHSISHDDQVLFKISEMLPPVMRIIRGVPGDQFEVFADSEKNRWKVKINGKVITASNGEFVWGNPERETPLKRQVDEFKGVIPPGKTIMFSNLAPGVSDSGTFGLVNIDQIQGRLR